MNTQTIFGAAALTVAIAGCGSGAVHHSPPPPMASSCEYATSVDGSTVVIRWHNSAQKMSCHAELAALDRTGMQGWHATAMPTNNRSVCEVTTGGMRIRVFQVGLDNFGTNLESAVTVCGALGRAS
jgi:hypothetical protein